MTPFPFVPILIALLIYVALDPYVGSAVRSFGWEWTEKSPAGTTFLMLYVYHAYTFGTRSRVAS